MSHTFIEQLQIALRRIQIVVVPTIKVHVVGAICRHTSSMGIDRRSWQADE